MYYNWDKMITENKALEIEVHKNEGVLFQFNFKIQPTKIDHGGATFEICLFERELAIRLYDCRHWDYDENRWMVYDEQVKDEIENEEM